MSLRRIRRFATAQRRRFSSHGRQFSNNITIQRSRESSSLRDEECSCSDCCYSDYDEEETKVESEFGCARARPYTGKVNPVVVREDGEVLSDCESDQRSITPEVKRRRRERSVSRPLPPPPPPVTYRRRDPTPRRRFSRPAPVVFLRRGRGAWRDTRYRTGPPRPLRRGRWP